ncbi:MAG: DUF2202 domain-containing protein [Bacteroidota bacterium]
MTKGKFSKSFVIFSLLLSLLVSCDKNSSSDDNNNSTVTVALTVSEEHSLLFMLEEEKLARDTYTYLNTKWTNTPFANILGSEQTHMDAIKSLLDANGTAYTILPAGQFSEAALQNYYNQFIVDGAISLSKALAIGATIEDLDIVDLQKYTNETTNQSVIDVYGKLECGSRNHLRSFYKSITALSETYSPQFLTVEAYNSIVNSASEKCNQ